MKLTLPSRPQAERAGRARMNLHGTSSFHGTSRASLRLRRRVNSPELNRGCLKNTGSFPPRFEQRDDSPLRGSSKHRALSNIERENDSSLLWKSSCSSHALGSPPMLKCVICGSDTILCVSGRPFCIACDDRLQGSEGEALKIVSAQGQPESGEPQRQCITQDRWPQQHGRRSGRAPGPHRGGR
jgi:hypothetical protein